MDREIAVAAHPDRPLGIFVRQPAEPPCGADRAVGRCSFDSLALGERLLAGLPDRLEGIDQPQDRAITPDERPICLACDLVEGGERRLGLGQPPL